LINVNFQGTSKNIPKHIYGGHACKKLLQPPKILSEDVDDQKASERIIHPQKHCPKH